MKTVQWAPTGPLSGVPSEICRLLADASGRTRGYGNGPDCSMGFGTEHGDVYVRPGQWVTRYDDGTVTVTDERPEPGDPPTTASEHEVVEDAGGDQCSYPGCRTVTSDAYCTVHRAWLSHLGSGDRS